MVKRDFLEFGFADGTKLDLIALSIQMQKALVSKMMSILLSLNPKDEVVADQNVANTENQETV